MRRMTRALRLALGMIYLVFGVAFLAPPLIALYFSMEYFTVELRPWWIKELLEAMAVIGAVMITQGINLLRCREDSN